MRSRIILFLVITVTALIVASHSGLCQETTIADFVDLDRLRSSGDDWEVGHEQVAAGSGRIVLQHDQWLMYFLHWRLLSEISEELSEEYTKHHLLNFWGESMPFELTGEGGSTEINGHRAYFVDGTIYDGRIKTRFIVWNCEQTGRQFTSDCNINLSLGTNPEYLELQERMTRTVCCHGGCEQSPVEGLEGQYSSEALNLSFLRPANWKTSEFEAKTWFPGGATASNGSLWTLLTDSERRIELVWGEPYAADQLHMMLSDLVVDTTAVRDTLVIGGYELDTTYVIGKRTVAEGALWVHNSRNEQRFADKHSLVATAWSNNGRTYLLLASVIQNSEIWGRPADLKPTKATLDSFARDVVYPAVRVLPAAE